MKFLKELREKPEHIRKVVLWAIIAVVGLAFAVLWIYNSKKSINEFRDKNIIQEVNLPNLEQENQ
ncbi:MAG: hypothetical protein U9Q16_01635 [Patescibacteria group bacterium]|nr:hypothetical protein [Patescibacteria group bacterium]